MEDYPHTYPIPMGISIPTAALAIGQYRLHPYDAGDTA